MSNQPVEKRVVLVLFHNDLRVHDNATLTMATQLASESSDARLLLVYAAFLADTLNQKNWGQSYHFEEMGQARTRFLEESLSDLDESLQSLGNKLLYLKGTDSTDTLSLAVQLCQLIDEQGVTDICVSQTADYAQNLAYETLQNKYPQISWHSQSTATLFATMPTKELPNSFTQFRKKVEYSHNLLNAQKGVDISPMPKRLPPIPESLAQNTECFFAAQASDERAQLEPRFKGGETQALAHLERYFDSRAPSIYKSTRNALDTWSHTTKFSPWLANGSLSVQTLLNRLRCYERQVIANDSTYWIWFELLWREYFYWYAMTHQKDLFLFKGISTQPPSTGYDKQRLEQWQNGATPYPIVNACMRQLNNTGYMSNRGRQLVASAFIHELELDWRYGATYFEQQLIDYDVASNWGNWQYLAGVGADPRGCRQFNLKKQTQQHDPDGDFRDKWLV